MPPDGGLGARVSGLPSGGQPARGRFLALRIFWRWPRRHLVRLMSDSPRGPSSTSSWCRAQAHDARRRTLDQRFGQRGRSRFHRSPADLSSVRRPPKRNRCGERSHWLNLAANVRGSAPDAASRSSPTGNMVGAVDRECRPAIQARIGKQAQRGRSRGLCLALSLNCVMRVHPADTRTRVEETQRQGSACCGTAALVEDDVFWDRWPEARKAGRDRPRLLRQGLQHQLGGDRMQRSTTQ